MLALEKVMKKRRWKKGRRNAVAEDGDDEKADDAEYVAILCC
ncbi:MAG: hypothetical protein QWI73_05275 [Alphaproteobacteria bacterium]|nr:hypothetical protein [Alphaproteobacteria bacterium]